MLFKICLLLLIFYLSYKYLSLRKNGGDSNRRHVEQTDHRFDISRVEEAQYRDVDNPPKESEKSE